MKIRVFKDFSPKFAY